MRASISVSELTAALVGRIPEDLLRSKQLTIYQGGGSYQLLSKDFSRVAIVDAKSLLPSRFEVRTSSGRRINLVVVYGGYQQVDGVSLPGSLTIEVPEKGFTMRLQLSIVSVNQDYPDSLFKSDIPSNFSVEELGS
jgi:outer membrane lipoprotein-sorting protein